MEGGGHGVDDGQLVEPVWKLREVTMAVDG